MPEIYKHQYFHPGGIECKKGQPEVAPVINKSL